MFFAAPWMLIGLAALSLPILIHLLDRAGGEAVDWPTLRFVKIARQQAAQRARLKNILVLLARCLLLALLILAMAQPYTQDTGWARPAELPTTLVIVLDNSYSMGYRLGGEQQLTRFDRAKALATERLAGLSLEDEVGLVLINERAVTVTDRPSRDHERIRKLINSAKLSFKGTNLATGLTTAFALGSLDASETTETEQPASHAEPPVVRKQRQAWREVLLLTDMQRGAWNELINDKLIANIDQPLPVTVIDLSDGQSANRYLRELSSPSASGNRLTVQAGIAGQAQDGGEQATLWIDGCKVGSPEFVSASTDKIKLQADFPAPGFHSCMVQLDEDRLPIDDSAYFAINSLGPCRLTIVDGDPSDVPALTETYFLNAAVTHGLADSSGVEVNYLSQTQLSTTPLGNSSCLLLANVPHLDGSALTRVENFLRAGGAVLVTLGDKVDINHYNRDWHFLPIKLTGRLGDPQRSRAYGIAAQAVDHPIFAGSLDLSATRFFAFIGCDPTTLGSHADIVASFSNGSPALIESKFEQRQGQTGGGRVLLLTGSIDADWSNLPYRRVFVPLLDRMISYLTKQGTGWRSIRSGEPIRFHGPSALLGQPVTITAPDGTTRTLNAVHDEKMDSAFVEYSHTDQIGIYQVQAENAFATGGGFAVNLDTRESILTPADTETIREAFPKESIRFVQDRPQVISTLDQVGPAKLRQQRRDYWPWMLLAALVVLVAETLLANLYTRRRAVRSPLTTEYMSTRRAQNMLTVRRPVDDVA